MTVQTEDVAALMPRMPSKKHFQRVDSGTRLMRSIGAIRQKRAKTRIQLQKREGRRRCELCRVESPCVREFQCTTDMYFLQMSSTESSRMILICSDLRFDVLGYLPLQAMPRRVKKRAIIFFRLPFSFHHLPTFFHQNTKISLSPPNVSRLGFCRRCQSAQMSSSNSGLRICSSTLRMLFSSEISSVSGRIHTAKPSTTP